MKREINPNLRFWTYLRNGWVKITLKAGQSLSWHHSSRDDEGSSFETSQWTHDGDRIMHEWCNGGSDCDGPIRRSGAEFAKADELAMIRAWVQPRPEVVKEASTQMNAYYFRQWSRELEKSEYTTQIGTVLTILRPAWSKEKETRVHDARAEAAGY